MGTVENMVADVCFICCKKLSSLGATSYTNHHVLKYTKMTVINCLRKFLSSCIQTTQKGKWDLWLCLACDKIIRDLDNFLHQYTKTRAKLQLVYTEAHSHVCSERNVEHLEDTEKLENSCHDAESRFLQKLSDRCSSKRIIKSNPRYADETHSNTRHNKCSLCNREHQTKAALEAHMEGIHGQKKTKRSRGRPRKYDRHKITIFPSDELVSKDESVVLGDSKISTDGSDANEKECEVMKESQSFLLVNGTHYLETEPSSSDTVCQGSSVSGVSMYKSKSLAENREESLLVEDKNHGSIDSEILGTVLSDMADDNFLTAPRCSNHEKNHSLINESYSNAERKKKIPKPSDKKYMRQEKCSKCGKVVVGRMKLRRHMLMHSTSQEQKSCEVCGRVLHNITAYKVHMLRLHDKIPKSSALDSANKKSCDICGKTYRGASGLSYHLAAKHNKGPRYPCDKCDRVFPHSRNLSSHKAQAHGSYSVICEYCGETFKLQTQLNSHINSVHHGITSWECTLCSSKFSSHIDYRLHINKHKRVTYECDACGKQYSWREALRKHKRTKHECFLASVSYDCSAVTPSIISETISPHDEGIDNVTVLPKENTESSVEGVRVTSAASLQKLLEKPENVDNGIYIDAALEPIILGGNLQVSQKAMDSGSVLTSLISATDLSIGEREIISDTPVLSMVSSAECDSPEKDINTNTVISVPETDCVGNFERVEDSNELPFVVSDKVRCLEDRLPLPQGAARTCEAVLPCREPQAITAAHVEEVVIVETDANANFDYIVYHVSS